MTTRTQTLWLATIVVFFAGIALTFAAINPPFEATDEIRHYRFVRSLVENGVLPVQGEEICRSQSHHPPLYYATAALLTGFIDTESGICDQPERNPFWAYRFADVGVDNKTQYLQDGRAAWDWTHWAVFLARAVNVGFGAITVGLTWLIGRKIAPSKPRIALAAAAIVAFNPMFGYMSGAINNDIVAAMSSALVLLICIQLNNAAEGVTARWSALFGLAFGLALLSKFNNAALLAVIEFTIVVVAVRKRQWLAIVWANVAFILTSGLLSGWWFVRNQRLYGEPTGVQRLTELWGVRAPSDSVGLAISELPQVWTSLWGRFGFGQIPMPTVLYQLLFVLVLLGLGLALFVLATQAFAREWAAATDTLLLFIFVSMFATVTFYYMLISPAGAMGRFFFPGLPALALLVAIGFGRIPPLNRSDSALSLAIGTPMLLLSLFAIFFILRPAVTMPMLNQGVATALDETLDPSPTLDQFAKLVAWEASADSVSPGETLSVKLDWEVIERPIGNFIMFVHLRDEAGFVTQRDTHAGTGRFPTGHWRAGDRFVDEIQLHLPVTARVSDSAEISIGFYAPNGGFRLPFITVDGNFIDDVLPLGSVTIAANDRFPDPQHFEQELDLLGASYSGRVLETDDELLITFDWLVKDDISADYEIQLLLLDKDGNYRGSADVTPSTGDWLSGQTQQTTHSFQLDALPAPIEAGEHQIRLAVQDKATGEKVPHVHPSGNEIGEYIDLPPIRITE